MNYIILYDYWFLDTPGFKIGDVVYVIREAVKYFSIIKGTIYEGR
jgi:hypothetical protein